MFCLHHSGLLFVFLHSPRVREEATTLISLPCKTPFLLPTTGSCLWSSAYTSAPRAHACSDKRQAVDPDKHNYCNLQEFTYLTQPTLTPSSLLFVCFPSSLTSHSQASTWLSCGPSYFSLHWEVISYAASRRDTAFFYDFRQLLGNTDFLPPFQLKAKVSESNNKAQYCSSIFQC